MWERLLNLSTISLMSMGQNIGAKPVEQAEADKQLLGSG